MLPNGKVLVAGGQEGSFNFPTGTELYDPATNTWTASGSLNMGRTNATATLLPNGKVLLAGGYNGASRSNCELYDPVAGWARRAILTRRSCSATARC